METEVYLLSLYVAIVLTNTTVLFLLWRSSGTVLYRRLAIGWLFGIVALAGSAATAKMGHFAQAVGFSACFLYYYWIALPLAKMAEVRMNWKSYALALATGLILAAPLAGTAPRLSTLIVTIPTGLPAIFVGAVCIYKHWGKLSLALRCYAVALLIDGLHALDYALAQGNPELVKVGFTFGIAVGVALTVFAPGAILERVAEEKVRLELELAYKARVSNAAKLSALGEMAGGIAHEINNPLAILKVLTSQMNDLLESPKTEHAQLRAASDKLSATVDRIARIVTGLRIFARDGSRDPLHSEPVSRIIENTLALCQEKFRSLGIRVSVESGEPSLEVVCRPVEISQILLNLLNNSTDAVSQVQDKWIQIGVRKLGKQAEIEVVDSGKGIPQEVREKIFQPFFTTKAIGHGTGLGLSVSRGIAEAHGGSLSVAPEGEHTRFVLSLPVSA